MMRAFHAALSSLCLSAAALPAQDGADFRPLRFGDPEELAYHAPLFPATEYDPGLPAPEALLGQLQGSRIARHAEIVHCLRTWAERTPRLQVLRYGTSFEGRELIAAVISAPENLERLGELQAQWASLAGGEWDEAEAEFALAHVPACAWLGYSIHGDELSGSDAALALAYHLAAGRSRDVEDLLRSLVIVIDPVMNPDGRERIAAMVEQAAGYAPHLDPDSLQRGRWPWGRGNHYLFDLNRDWMLGVGPETRGRWTIVQQFHPQLFVDAHELSAQDTYLFYPQAAPHNPYLPPRLAHWQHVFAAEQAAAFDRHGWTYYTREWADAWAPFYSDAWGALNGAVGLLYEQARTLGFPLRRAGGRVLTYREAVHHHAASSLANLQTLRARREELLRDFWQARRANRTGPAADAPREFVLMPGRNAERERALLALLLAQGVQVRRAPAAFTAANARGARGQAAPEREFPAGSYRIAARQAQAPLVQAYLDFDLQLDPAAQRRERERLERRGETSLYDLTSWNLGQAFDLDAWWCDAAPAEAEPLTAAPTRAGRLVSLTQGAPAVAWAVDGGDDVALAFAVAALERGLTVHLGDQDFRAGGRAFARWSLLVRGNENGADAGARVEAAALHSGATAYALATSRSPDDGPDLGGTHFHLLERPRVALLAEPPIEPETCGGIWFLLDHELRLPHARLDARGLADQDLRRFNVLVIPSHYASLEALKPQQEALRRWVEDGGTLIACGNSAAALAHEDWGLCHTRRRGDVLEQLQAYSTAARLELAARWPDEAPADYPPASKEEETWAERFLPRGAILRALVDQDEWLSAGCDGELPVLVQTDGVLLAKEPARTPLRLASAERLRLSGLLWPEAQQRLALSAYCTVEAVEHGQVILFAANPGYRMLFRGTGRLLGNALVYGPGLGAEPARGG